MIYKYFICSVLMSVKNESHMLSSLTSQIYINGFESN